MYSVKEIYYSIQGEGRYSGRPAVFVRFSGCNLWSGLEKDRFKAQCNFCDTDFVGINGVRGGKFSCSKNLVGEIERLWPEKKDNKFVVFTGGEPMLQLDMEIIDILKQKGFFTAIETNGSIEVTDNIDWVCVSPKNTKLVQKFGDELKLVYPQDNLQPDEFVDLDFKYFYLQPLYNKDIEVNIKKTIRYCLKHPKWNLSLQKHKILKIK